MKLVLKVFIPVIAILLAGLLLYVSCGKDKTNTPSGPSTEWTILVYADGNNNLDAAQGGGSYCIQDIQDLEGVSSNDKVQIVAMVASMRTGGGAKYYHIEHFPDDLGDNISSPILENKGTKDMSDWQTLKEFLNYGLANYPAKKYMLIIDDHGAGWPGSCVDDQNGSGRIMSTYDMANAVEQASSANNVAKFEIVTFHACLMSMIEVAYEFRNSANYLVASEFSMPMESVLGSNIWLTNLVANPTLGARDLATNIAEAVYQAGIDKQKIVHMAATDLSKIGHLAAKVDNFGTQLSTSIGDHWDELLDAWLHTNTTQYDGPAYVDIRELANKVKQEPNLQNINLISHAADSVITALNDAIVITNTNAQGITRGGLTIHMPYLRNMYDSTNYARLEFQQVPWTNFVSGFIGQIEQIISQATLNGSITWQGNTLSHPILALIDTSGTIMKFWRLNGGAESVSFSASFDVAEVPESYVYAFDDLDNDGTVGEQNEPWNCYDSDGDQYCEWYTYQAGVAIDNVDIIIYSKLTGHHGEGPFTLPTR
jgi:hypothetical protein